MDVSFIGLGLMGSRMTRNLINAGHRITVHNRSQAAVDELVTEGALRASSTAEAAQASEFVMTALPTPRTVEDVFLGSDGIVENARDGAILIDFSTNGPDTARRCAEAAYARGLGYLDAPMSGGPAGAEAGTLSIMTGGEKAHFEASLGLLEVLGQKEKIFHCGAVGAGSVVKLANQLLVGVANAACAEAFVMAAKYGLDVRQLYDILNGAMAQSAVMTWTIPDSTLKRDFSPRFAVDLITKDLGLITDFGKEQGVRLAMATMADLLHREAQSHGEGENNLSAVIRPLERLAGVEVGSAD